jgi:hypothetical protein
MAKGLVIGVVANVLSTKILHAGNEWEEQADAIDQANGVPSAKRDDGILPYIPFLVGQIASAVAARVGIEVIWKMEKARVDNFAKDYQKNTGDTPDVPGYGARIKAYGELQQSMFEGDWDKYLIGP